MTKYSVEQLIDGNSFQIRLQYIDVLEHSVFFNRLIVRIAIRFDVITSQLEQKYYGIKTTSLGEAHTLVKNSRFFFVLI